MVPALVTACSGFACNCHDYSYAFVKQVHVAVVMLTIILFVVRATWRLHSPERLQQRWVKIVPHLVDTVLLLSGFWLAWQLGAAGVRGWLGAKLVASCATSHSVSSHCGQPAPAACKLWQCWALS
jgi:cytochrome b561